ncbi:head-tail connector protein [Paracoccus sp. KR1-242]|uniref:head-tail connector protein n=1 Tax=Paracoccus sp. KR1-242 TaxID=3410028 RepID=UPI003C095CB6
MRLTLVTPPAAPPIERALAKDYCKVSWDYEDAVIDACIDAAVSWLDGQRGVLRRCIVNQVWRADIDRLGGYVALPFPDVSTVSAVFTDEEAGAVLFDRTDCGLRIRSGQGRPAAITFTAGFGTPSEVPPAISRAILILAGHFYWVRSGQSEREGIPREVDDLISPFRLLRV